MSIQKFVSFCSTLISDNCSDNCSFFNYSFNGFVLLVKDYILKSMSGMIPTILSFEN